MPGFQHAADNVKICKTLSEVSKTVSEVPYFRSTKTVPFQKYQISYAEISHVFYGARKNLNHSNPRISIPGANLKPTFVTSYGWSDLFVQFPKAIGPTFSEVKWLRHFQFQENVLLMLVHNKNAISWYAVYHTNN